MRKKTGRYSGYIRPFSYALDLTVINTLSIVLLPTNFNVITFHLFVSLAWIILAYSTHFYEVYRYTKVFEIFGKIIKQLLLFFILNFAYIGYFSKYSDTALVIKFIFLSVLLVSFSKLFIYYFLRKYRVVFGGNFRRVVIAGSGKTVEQLDSFLMTIKIMDIN